MSKPNTTKPEEVPETRTRALASINLPARPSSPRGPKHPETRSGVAGSSRAAPTNLADVRRARQRERANLGRAVDDHMDWAVCTQVAVPWIYIWIAGSIAPASALRCIEAASERQFHLSGDPWVFLELDQWLNETGLCEDTWTASRGHLRAAGLIEEHRQYDLASGRIVTRIRFMPEAFCHAQAQVRQEVREGLRVASMADRPPR